MTVTDTAAHRSPGMPVWVWLVALVGSSHFHLARPVGADQALAFGPHDRTFSYVNSHRDPDRMRSGPRPDSPPDCFPSAPYLGLSVVFTRGAAPRPKSCVIADPPAIWGCHAITCMHVSAQRAKQGGGVADRRPPNNSHLTAGQTNPMQ